MVDIAAFDIGVGVSFIAIGLVCTVLMVPFAMSTLDNPQADVSRDLILVSAVSAPLALLLCGLTICNTALSWWKVMLPCLCLLPGLVSGFIPGRRRGAPHEE